MSGLPSCARVYSAVVQKSIFESQHRRRSQTYPMADRRRRKEQGLARIALGAPLQELSGCRARRVPQTGGLRERRLR